MSDLVPMKEGDIRKDGLNEHFELKEIKGTRLIVRSFAAGSTDREMSLSEWKGLIWVSSGTQGGFDL